MKRRSFIKGVMAAGAASLLSAGAVTTLLQGCSESSKVTGWDFDEVIDRSGTWSIKNGTGGEGFVRINVGCPRSILQAALESIRRAM